ncbi:phage tail protein [Escherichia fergusonii]|uniref:phage tail protein n=1 Tax=Escherichia fergusonii TaxID=564 RepID=UPI0020CBC789|nr:phage tail protein [Escherichia fergusonii]MCP9660860.1 phage tail protein [Escherichia fergusonii]
MADSQFYSILTDRGAILEASALASGNPVVLNKFVIGDGNGQPVTPDKTRTSLVREVYRGNIQKVESNGNQVTFTLYVPPEAGGYTIREAGILTASGELYSLSNSPDILKPVESNGAVISITFKYILAVSSTSTVSVTVFNDYLTPADADKKYLQISKNLSEIASNGGDAQLEARKNIGIDGDVAYRDESNTFTKQNTFKDEVFLEDILISKKQININKPGTELTLFSLSGLSDVSGDYLDISTRGESSQKVFYRLRGIHYDGLILLCNGKQYKYWNEGNLKPVKSVNGSTPDANGNVSISTGSSESFTDIKLGAQVYADGLVEAPSGCVVTFVDGGDEMSGIGYRPIYKKINGNWVMTTGD